MKYLGRVKHYCWHRVKTVELSNYRVYRAKLSSYRTIEYIEQNCRVIELSSISSKTVELSNYRVYRAKLSSYWSIPVLDSFCGILQYMLNMLKNMTAL